ncbi:MAG: PH domain-containing protein [Clostridium sp.]|uniref:PH domain-containing protein n=1 Tax=Clostridium sp. TaxID=1506 RepID=UPI003EE4D55A
MIKSENKPFIILMGFIAIFFTFVIIFISVMITPTTNFKITLANNEIEVSGKNAQNISLNDVTEIKLLNKSPQIIFNGGGDAGNSIMYGNNYLKGLGLTTCYVNDVTGKAIYIKTNKIDVQYLISLDNSRETEKLYEELLKDVKK